ncbi:MAG: branched-chain amino acid ABC transporter permease [Coriobacteriia bacterium]
MRAFRDRVRAALLGSRLGTVRVARVGLAATGLVGAFVAPSLLESRFTVKILTFTAIDLVVVTGLALLFGYAGQISLGHAGFFGLGAYTSAILTTTYGAPWIVGMACGTLVAALGGLLLAIPSLRLRGHYLAMATLGFGEIARVAFVQLRSVTGGPDGFHGIPPASFAGLTIETPQADFTFAWVVAVLAMFLVSNLGEMRPGRALKAMHGSELGAKACGVDVSRMKITVFTISAGMAGLAGVLYAHAVGFISPSTFTLNLSIVLLAMVVLGGPGSLSGAAAATVVLSLLPFLDALIPGIPRDVAAALQDWQHDIYGAVIILVMLFMPKGLAGAGRAAARKLRAMADQRAASSEVESA